MCLNPFSLYFNPIALRTANTPQSFGPSECYRVNVRFLTLIYESTRSWCYLTLPSVSQLHTVRFYFSFLCDG